MTEESKLQQASIAKIDPPIKKVLGELIATSNSGKYKDLDEVLSKFPELKGYKKQVLGEYISTANSGKYKSIDEVNNKFPEFFEKKKEFTSVSTAPIQNLGSEQVVGSSASQKPKGFPEIEQPFDALPNRAELAKETPQQKEYRLKKELSSVKVTTKNMDEVARKTDELSALKKENITTNNKIKEDTSKVNEKNNEVKSLGGGLANRIGMGASTFSKSIYDTPKMLLDLAYAPQNYLADKFNIPELKVNPESYSFENNPSKEMDKMIKNYDERIKNYKQEIGGDVVSAYDKGDYVNAFKHATLNSAESVPLMIAAIATGGESLMANTVIGTSSASTQYDKLSKDNPELSTNEKLANAAVNGALEVVVGKFMEGVSGNVWRQLLSEKGKKEGAKIVTNSFKKSMEKIVGKNPITALPSEYIEERATDAMQQANDIATGIQTEFNMDQNRGAGLSSLGFSAPNVAGMYGVKIYSNQQTKNQVKEANKAVLGLQKDLSNPNLSEEQKNVIKGTINDIYDKNKNILGAELKKFDAIPQAEKVELIEIDNTLEDLQSQAIEIKHSNDISDENKMVLLANLKAKHIEANERKEEILSKSTKSNFSELPLKEQEKVKKQALESLVTELNPDGKKDMTITDQMVTKRANEIYTESNLNEKQNAKIEVPTAKTETKTEVQKQPEAEKVEPIQESVEIAPIEPKVETETVETAQVETPEISPLEKAKQARLEAKAKLDAKRNAPKEEVVEPKVETPKVEKVAPEKQTGKVITPNEAKNEFSEFENIVNDSKDANEAFGKARAIQGVPAKTSKAFKAKYNPKGDLTPKQAFEKFYNEVKSKSETANISELETETKPKVGDKVDFGDGEEVITGFAEIKGETFIKSKPIEGNMVNRESLNPLSEYNDVVSKQEEYSKRREENKKAQEERDIQQKLKEEKQQAKQKEFDDIDGFAEDKTKIQKGKILQHLNKIGYGGKTLKTELRRISKLPYRIVERDGRKRVLYTEESGTEFVLNDLYSTKTGIEYLEYLSNQKQVEANKGKEITPNEKVSTDVETVKKELNLDDVDSFIYDNLNDTPDDKKESKVEQLKDDKLGEIDAIETKINDIDIKIEDNGIAIDKIEEDETLTPAKKKKAIAVLEKEFKDLQAQQKVLEEQKENTENFLKDFEDRLFYSGVDFNDAKIKEVVDKVNTRLETRKAVKEGTDLFPETANISELEAKPTSKINYAENWVKKTNEELEANGYKGNVKLAPKTEYNGFKVGEIVENKHNDDISHIKGFVDEDGDISAITTDNEYVHISNLKKADNVAKLVFAKFAKIDGNTQKRNELFLNLSEAQKKEINNYVPLIDEGNIKETTENSNIISELETKKAKAKSKVSEASQVRKEAKAKLDAKKRNLGIASDPKQDAQDLYDYHQALVAEAKEYIKLGIATLSEFADALGEKVSISVKQAWEEANGDISPIKKGEDLSYDFSTIDQEVVDEEKVAQNEPKEAKKEFKREEGKSSVLKRIREGGNSKEVNDIIDEIGLNYEKRKQEQIYSDAVNFVKQVGVAEAYNAIKSGKITNSDTINVIYATILQELPKIIGEQASKITNEAELNKTVAELDELNLTIYREFKARTVDAGQGISMLNYIINQDLAIRYSLAAQIDKFKSVNNGVVPDDVMDQLKDLDKRYKEATSRIEELERLSKEAQEQADFDNIVEEEKRQPKMSKSKREKADKIIKSLDDFEKSLLKNTYADPTMITPILITGVRVTKAAIKAGVTVSEAIEQGIENIKKELAKIGETFENEQRFRDDLEKSLKLNNISTDKPKVKVDKNGKLIIPSEKIKDFIANGGTDLSVFAEQILDEVNQEFPDVTIRDIRESVSNYGRKSNKTKPQIQKDIENLKLEERLRLQLEDLQDGIKKEKNEVKKKKMSDVAKRLREQIKQLQDYLGITEEERTERSVNYTKKRIEELREKIKNNDFSKKQVKPIIENEELKKARIEKNRVQEEFDYLSYQQELKNRTGGERVSAFFKDLYDSQRVTLATGELSFVGAQGWFYMVDRTFSRDTLKNLITNFKGTKLKDWQSNPFKTALGIVRSASSASTIIDMMKAMGTANTYHDFQSLIKEDPNYDIYLKMGLRLLGEDIKTQVRDDNFIGNNILNLFKIPIHLTDRIKKEDLKNFKLRLADTEKKRTTVQGYWEKLKTGNISEKNKKTATEIFSNANALAMFERGNNMFMNLARKELADIYIAELKASGKNPVDHLEDFKKLGSAINTITGSGNMHQKLEMAIPSLNKIMFSARYFTASLNLTPPISLFYLAKLGNYENIDWTKPSTIKNFKPTAAQKAFIKPMLKGFAASMGVSLIVVALKNAAIDDDDELTDEEKAKRRAYIEYDPRSSDWLQVVNGNTRTDYFGPYRNNFVLMSKLWTGQTKKSNGEIIENGQKNTRTDFQILTEYGAGKLNPALGIFARYFQGKKEEVMNEETGLMEERRMLFDDRVGIDYQIKHNLVPIFVKTAQDVLEEDPTLGASFHNAWAFIGKQTNVYKKQAEKSDYDLFLKEQEKKRKLFDLPVTEKSKIKTEDKLQRAESTLKMYKNLKIAQERGLPYYFSMTSHLTKEQVQALDLKSNEASREAIRENIDRVKKEHNIK